MAISTNDADKPSRELRTMIKRFQFLQATSNEQPETVSCNVIGEIRGTEHPGEVIVFGGHLDAWDERTGRP